MKIIGFDKVRPIRRGPIRRDPASCRTAGYYRKIDLFRAVAAPIGIFLVVLLVLAARGQAADSESAESPESSKSTAEPIALFNGKDLTGWRQLGDAHWEVREGLLIGRQGPDGAAGDLLTEASFDNFRLMVTYKVHWPANTGIWYRYQSSSQAYQADILEYKNPIAYSGSLYCPGKLFIAINKDPKLVHREGWNRLVIRVEGDRHFLHLNGAKVADVHDDSSDHGKIGIQVHAGDVFDGMQVTIKEMTLQPL